MYRKFFIGCARPRYKFLWRFQGFNRYFLSNFIKWVRVTICFEIFKFSFSGTHKKFIILGFWKENNKNKKNLINYATSWISLTHLSFCHRNEFSVFFSQELLKLSYLESRTHTTLQVTTRCTIFHLCAKILAQATQPTQIFIHKNIQFLSNLCTEKV